MNDPPPGTDEVVAMTQIVKFLEEGIVLPNGDQMVSILFLNHTYNCAVHYIYLHSFTSFLKVCQEAAMGPIRELGPAALLKVRPEDVRALTEVVRAH